jgi:hypothetical protein
VSYRRAAAEAAAREARRALREKRKAELTRVRREDAVRFVEEIRGDEPALARYLRIEERELEAGRRN